MRPPSRRALLSSVLAGFAAAAWARPAGGRRLVLVTAYGGWDATFAFDPKSPDLVDGPELDEDPDVPEDREGVETLHGIPVALNDHKRPALRAFVERWGERLLVVNGVHTGSIAHEACRTRVLTGTLSTASADLCAIAASLRPEVPVPYLDLGGLGLVGPLASQSGRSGRSNQLVQLLDRAAERHGPGGVVYPQYHPTGAEAAAISGYLDAEWARAAGDLGDWGRGASRVASGADARARAVALLADGADFARELAGSATGTLVEQADLAVELLAQQLSAGVSVDSGLLWDTHVDNVDQHAAWDAFAAGLDHLVSGLDAAGLLEDTVVLVVSEMHRTPRRNDGEGKDHWPVTSALLLGGGVRGGRVIGATDDRSDAVAVDLATGAPDPAGVVLRHDHLAAGVLEHVGVDAEAWLPGVPALRGLA